MSDCENYLSNMVTKGSIWLVVGFEFLLEIWAIKKSLVKK